MQLSWQLFCGAAHQVPLSRSLGCRGMGGGEQGHVMHCWLGLQAMKGVRSVMCLHCTAKCCPKHFAGLSGRYGCTMQQHHLARAGGPHLLPGSNPLVLQASQARERSPYATWARQCKKPKTYHRPPQPPACTCQPKQNKTAAACMLVPAAHPLPQASTCPPLCAHASPSHRADGPAGQRRTNTGRAQSDSTVLASTDQMDLHGS